MASVKKSFYIDSEVDEALKRAAEARGVNQTRQLNAVLRRGLGLGSREGSGEGLEHDLARPARPDPKVKAPRRGGRRS